MPHGRAEAISTSLGSCSRARPTRTSREIAMQRWPAEPKAAEAIEFSADFMFASSSSTAWFCAPRFACTRLPAAPPRR